MRYLKLFESFDDINEICKKYNIKNYTINTDGSIDVDGYANLFDKNLKKLPLKFNKINRWFDCSYNKLTSLEGSPVEVNSGFRCDNNKLTSFEGSPVEVNGGFYCNENNLTSFEFAPKRIRGHFLCWNNNIKSFEYFPNFVKEYFYCDDNPIYEVWILFEDWTKIDLLNDCDIFRDEDTDTPSIFINRLNDFLGMIDKSQVKNVDKYKNI